MRRRKKMSEIIISEKSIFTNLAVPNKETALEVMAQSLEEQGFLNEEFYQNLMARERVSPTGLETFEIGIAIPHTEPKYVKTDSIGVAVLEKPVAFKDMVTKEKEIEVKVIFLLGLSESTKHLNILKQIIDLVQKEGALQKIVSLPKESLVKYLQEQLIAK